MAYYERWRAQHDADEWMKTLGFEEKLIHGIRLYYNQQTGETLDLYRPKQFYEKTLQHGINIAEGILERLVASANDPKSYTKNPREELRTFILNEKENLNKIKSHLDSKDNR